MIMRARLGPGFLLCGRRYALAAQVSAQRCSESALFAQMARNASPMRLSFDASRQKFKAA
jgi:hypothetical protein